MPRAMHGQFDIEWIDHKRESRHQPDPAWPGGKDIKAHRAPTEHDFGTCTARLDYPAKRCGLYVVTCVRCDARAACTTVGRSDDPRSIEIYCRARVH